MFINQKCFYMKLVQARGLVGGKRAKTEDRREEKLAFGKEAEAPQPPAPLRLVFGRMLSTSASCRFRAEGIGCVKYGLWLWGYRGTSLI